MPLFHFLRDIRAGHPSTRQTSRESAWSHANHQGYLTACETHASDALERHTQSQLTLLKKFASAWESRDKMSLFRLMNECEAFFDPNRPSTLVHFAGLGGIDLFVRLLCDNADWLTTQTTGLLLFHPDEGVNVYNTMLRVLTELLVCHNDVGWYIYDRHRCLMFRLMELVRVERARDSAIMLLEHIVSVVGPVLHIPSHPDFAETIRQLPDGGLASMCRVLALLVVPGVMTDQVWKSKRLEPFPQCLVRIEKIQQVVDDNVKWIIDEPGLVLRLLELGKVRSSGVRIFQGNRTMTVLAPPEPTEAVAHALPAGVAPLASVQALVNQLTSAVGTNGGSTSTPFTPPSSNASVSTGAATAMGNTMEFDDDVEDEDGDDDFFAGGGGGPDLVLSQEMLNNPAALQLALQQILQSVQQAPGGGGGAGAAAAPTTASPAPAMAVNNGSGQAQSTPQTLQSLAESLSHDMLPVNGLDSINFSWFCGRPDTKGRWRFHTMRAIRAEDERTFGLLQSASEEQRLSKQFVERMIHDESGRKARATQKQQRNNAAAEQQAIVNSQSEIFFVLNSIMVTCHYTEAWKLLSEYNVLERCQDAFDVVFFVGQQSTSIHASPPQRNRGQQHGHSHNNELGSADERFESAAVVAARQHRFYETFWIPAPATCIAASTTGVGGPSKSLLGGGEQGLMDDDEFATALRDDPAATTRDGDLSEDEAEGNGDHRHDPDTLRKLELLRIIHEFCNAQDRSECGRLMDGYGTVASVRGHMERLAAKIATQLATGVEDACTETVGAHALEGILRCVGFQSANRMTEFHKQAQAPQSQQSEQHSASAHWAAGNILLSHIIRERIYNATTGGSGTAHALAPFKRLDAFFAVVGELCKYNTSMLSVLTSYLRGNIPMATQPTFLGAHQPNAADVENALRSAPIARGAGESVLSVFKYRMRKFGVDTNLFIRCMCLTVTSYLSSPMNYVWKPLHRDAQFREESSLDEPDTDVEQLLATLQDSRGFLPEDRTIEPSKHQMQRMYYIRDHSRTLVGQLVAMAATQRATTQSEDDITCVHANRHRFNRDALNSIVRAPSFSATDPLLRPFPNLFSDEELGLLHPTAPLPRGGLSSRLRRAVIAAHGDPHTSTSTEGQQDRDFVKDALLDAPEDLVYSMLSALNAETMENTERLCVVTSTVLLFLRESHIRGQEGVDALLAGVARIARGRRDKYIARRRRPSHRVATADASSSPPAAAAPHPGDDPCSMETPLEEQCDNFVLFGHCMPHTIVRNYFELHGTDFFKNFFRLLCVWIAHYSCSQRYVETLFYCTEIPFGEWKVVVLYLFREVPNYFFSP